MNDFNNKIAELQHHIIETRKQTVDMIDACDRLDRNDIVFKRILTNLNRCMQEIEGHFDTTN